MAGIKVWLRLAFVYIVGLFWALLITVQVAKMLIFKRAKFFSKKNRSIPPDTLQDKLYGEHKYAAINQSIKLHYVESGPPDKPVMLYLHGFPDFWYSWRNQIKEFQKEYRVIAVDMRGYGGSSKPSGVSHYTIDILASDIGRLIEIVSPNRKCYLLAHDWGGLICWVVAGRYPHLLEKAIIMNCPHPGAFAKYLYSSWKQFIKSWYMFFINLPYYAEWFFSAGDVMFIENVFRGSHMKKDRQVWTAEDIEAYKYNFNKKSDFTGPMNYYRAFMRRTDKAVVKQRVPAACPVLLIWGTEDRALSTEMAEMCRPYADDFTIKYIQGCSHWVQAEEPDVVNKHVRDFLSN